MQPSLKPIINVCLAVFALAMLLPLEWIHAQAPPKSVPAPIWSMTDLDGKAIRLADFKGKVVVLNFWGTFCAPCVKEVPEFAAIQDSYLDKGVVVIGAAMDKNNEAGVRAFARNYFVNYPLVIATPSMLAGYKVTVAPVTFIIGKNGLIAYKHVGALNRQELSRQIDPLL